MSCSNPLVAYLLWLVGGAAGLPHFYLGRVCHGFVWLTTGGGFMIGWLCDLFQLPTYCAEAKRRREILLENAATPSTTASCSTYRFTGMLLTGGWYGCLGLLALPSSMSTVSLYDRPILAVTQSSILALASSFGVYLVGNIGLQQRPFLQCWLGAWPVSLFMLAIDASRFNGLIATNIAAILLCNRFAKVRTKRAPYGVSYVLVWAVCYLSFYVGILYNHVLFQKIYVNNRETTVGRLAWTVLKNGPEMLEKLNFYRADDTAEESWERYWRNFMDDAFQGDTLTEAAMKTHAYYILKVDRHASKESIRKKCRELMKEHHPDKTKGGDSVKFVQYREACERLGATSRPRDKNADEARNGDDSFYREEL